MSSACLNTLDIDLCGMFNDARPSWALPLRVRLQRAVIVAGCSAAINEKSGAADKRTFVAHEQLGHICHLVRCAGAADGTLGKHILVEIATGTIEFVQRQWRDNDAGGNGIEPSTTLTPRYGLRHNALFIAALGQLVGVEGIPDVLRL